MQNFGGRNFLQITIELMPILISALMTVIGLAPVYFACKMSGAGPHRDPEEARRVMAEAPYELLDLVLD